MGGQTGKGAVVGALTVAAIAATGGLAAPLVVAGALGGGLWGGGIGARNDANTAQRAQKALNNNLDAALNPKLNPMPDMPNQNSSQIQAAKAQMALSLKQRSGRDSTILTQRDNKMGG